MSHFFLLGKFLVHHIVRHRLDFCEFDRYFLFFMRP